MFVVIDDTLKKLKRRSNFKIDGKI